MFLVFILFLPLIEGSYNPYYLDENCATEVPPIITNQGCQRRYYPDGIVCVCNSTYCDAIAKPEKPNYGEFLIYTSNIAGLRFHKSVRRFEVLQDNDNEIRIDCTKQYQEIFGFGGAFTDSAGYNLNLLPEGAQDNILKTYFSDEGIEYNIGRIPMGGTDFSLRAYSYDDGPPDPDLKNFKLAPEDYNYKIPYVKNAYNFNNQLKLFTSTWTAPKWMKTNDNYTGIGLIEKCYYQTWANYFLKFFEEYHNAGVDFWGVTTGNEPFSSLIPNEDLESVTWPSWALQKWIAYNLGPTIRSSPFSDLKIMILDDQRAYIPWYIQLALKNPRARKFINGVAVHWYLDQYFTPLLLSETQALFPEMFILATEATNTGQVLLGSWKRGELYSADIIQDMLHWVIGWMDWNLVLDLQGGPNYIQNYCDAAIIINATSGEFYKQPMYYHLGHFSKFIPRGSIRIHTELIKCNIEIVAFQRPDSGTAVILLNRTNTTVSINLKDNRRGVAKLDLTPRSINTVLYW